MTSTSRTATPTPPTSQQHCVILGTAAGATGETWHLPVAPARTTREIIEHVYRQAGHPPRTLAAGRTTMRALGLVKPAMREYLHTLYQFTDPWVVDDSKFRTSFGVSATLLDDSTRRHARVVPRHRIRSRHRLTHQLAPPRPTPHHCRQEPPS